MDIPSEKKPAEGAGAEIDRPAPSAPSNRVWGSDAIAAAIRALDIPYVALNPGSSYRGLHDSLVNHLGNTRPRMLLCLHEESAVALAHGWAKVTGKPMLAVVHANVGLMHATMAIFNAWCDRAPLIVLGATGALDAVRRRPWIEWIHTARDQGALIRNFTKWDDQPSSVGRGAGGGAARQHDRADRPARAGLSEFRRSRSRRTRSKPCLPCPTSPASHRRRHPSPAARSCARRPNCWRGRSGR